MLVEPSIEESKSPKKKRTTRSFLCRDEYLGIVVVDQQIIRRPLCQRRDGDDERHARRSRDDEHAVAGAKAPECPDKNGGPKRDHVQQPEKDHILVEPCPRGSKDLDVIM